MAGSSDTVVYVCVEGGSGMERVRPDLSWFSGDALPRCLVWPHRLLSFNHGFTYTNATNSHRRVSCFVNSTRPRTSPLLILQLSFRVAQKLVISKDKNSTVKCQGCNSACSDSGRNSRTKDELPNLKSRCYGLACSRLHLTIASFAEFNAAATLFPLVFALTILVQRSVSNAICISRNLKAVVRSGDLGNQGTHTFSPID